MKILYHCTSYVFMRVGYPTRPLEECEVFTSVQQTHLTVALVRLIMKVIYAVSLLLMNIRALVNSEVHVKLSTLRGELGATSKLRCTLYQKDGQIAIIQWKSGGNKELVYFDSIYSSFRRGPRGRFRQRNVTAKFTNNYTSHELNVCNSKLEDETYYHCEVRSKSLAKHGASAFLNLTVQPKNRGTIKTSQGEYVNFSNCGKISDMPSLNVRDQISLICDVGPSRPPPEVQWENVNSAKLDNQTKSHWKNRVLLVSMSQTLMNVSLKQGEKLKMVCTVRIPDPLTGGLAAHKVCVLLIRGDDLKLPDWKITLICVPIIYVVAFLLAFLCDKITRYCVRQCRQPPKKEEMELLPKGDTGENERSSSSKIRTRRLKDGVQVDLSFCSLNEFPSEEFSIGSITNVVELNLSHNLLQELPAISQFPHLKRLFVQFCKLTSIEVHSPNSELEEINLEYNQLRSIPASILQLERLKILKLTGNPLMLPRAIIQIGYEGIRIYQKASKRNTERTPCLVIPVIGNFAAGKASFVKAINENLAHCEDEEEHFATVVKSGNAAHIGEIAFINFPTTQIYSMVYFHFLRDYGIIVLCVNGEMYKQEDHESHVTYWLETICERTRGNKVLILLTQRDLFKEEKDISDEKRNELLGNVKRWKTSKEEKVREQKAELQKELEQHDCLERQEKQHKYEQLSNMLENFSALSEEVHTFSTNSHQEIDSVYQAIINCLRDQVPEKIPAEWIDMHKALQHNYPGDLCVDISKSKATTDTHMHTIGNDEINVALKCLHSYALIFLSNPKDAVIDTVYHNPKMIFGVLQFISHLQMSELTKDVDKQPPGGNKPLSAEIMKTILSPYLDKEQIDYRQLIALLLHLRLCFEIKNTEEDEEYCFPFLLSEDMPQDESSYQQFRYTRCFMVLCTPGCPLSCFQTAFVRFSHLSTTFRWWKNGISGFFAGENFLKVRHDGSKNRIKVDVAGHKLNSVWIQMIHMHREIEDFLKEWPEIVGEFAVPCPVCLKENKPDITLFSGQYLTKPCQQRRIRCLKHGDMRIIQPHEVYPPENVLEQVLGRKSEARHYDYYLRLDVLITWYGPELLREILETEIQPLTLDLWLDTQIRSDRMEQKVVTELKKIIRWTPKETIQVADLNFDALFQIFTSYHTSFHCQSSEVTRTEDGSATTRYTFIQQLKELRDQIFANPHDRLSKKEFDEMSRVAEKIILALGGEKKRVDRILKKTISELFTHREKK